MGGRNFFRTKELSEGGEVRCLNCHNMLIPFVAADRLKLRMSCTRCKCQVYVFLRQPVDERVVKAWEEARTATDGVRKAEDNVRSV